MKIQLGWEIELKNSDSLDYHKIQGLELVDFSNRITPHWVQTS